MQNPKLCAICFRPYLGFGHNAEPIESGQCCNSCNATVVLARLSTLPIHEVRSLVRKAVNHRPIHRPLKTIPQTEIYVYVHERAEFHKFSIPAMIEDVAEKFGFCYAEGNDNVRDYIDSLPPEDRTKFID